jgi:hypothetical protein
MCKAKCTNPCIFLALLSSQVAGSVRRALRFIRVGEAHSFQGFLSHAKKAVGQLRDFQDYAGPEARAHPDLSRLRRSLESQRVDWL